MSTLSQTLLLLSLLWLLYTYAGYPLILYFLSQGRRSSPADHTLEPTVTILTAAYNEVGVIGENLENKLALDYPAEKLDIIVISDESEDGTDEIVQELGRANPGRIRLIRQIPRQGKTAGLNLAIPEAPGEILVFADANSLYEPQTLRRLVQNFSDPSVGYVTGKMVYTNPDGSVTGDGCTAYMRYENRIRSWETKVGSVVGVDGGIDAVRKSLYRPMRADQLPDFVLPLKVVEQGYRVVYEPEAVLREPALTSTAQEYRMRVRVALRAFWALYDLRHLLRPWRDPLFSWQLTSHKLMRYTAFLPLMLALVSSAILAPRGRLYVTLLGIQVAFYLLAGFGHLATRLGRRVPVATLPYYFTLLNVACLHAFGRFIRRQKQVMWQPRTG